MFRNTGKMVMMATTAAMLFGNCLGVDKENLIAIVDEQGVKYTAINWGKVKEGVQR